MSLYHALGTISYLKHTLKTLSNKGINQPISSHIIKSTLTHLPNLTCFNAFFNGSCVTSVFMPSVFISTFPHMLLHSLYLHTLVLSLSHLTHLVFSISWRPCQHFLSYSSMRYYFISSLPFDFDTLFRSVSASFIIRSCSLLQNFVFCFFYIYQTYYSACGLLVLSALILKLQSKKPNSMCW